MPDMRIMVTIGFDEDNPPTAEEQKTIVGNLREHVFHERDCEVPGFSKSLRAHAKSLDLLGGDEPAT
jgi:hypothetical protein